MRTAFVIIVAGLAVGLIVYLATGGRVLFLPLIFLPFVFFWPMGRRRG